MDAIALHGFGALLHVPTGTPPPGGWPALLFLHGIGERGTDVASVAAHGPPRLAKADPAFPFVVLAPQCPPDRVWTPQADALVPLVDALADRPDVDPDRIVATGLSMGGYGTWKLAARAADRLAGAVPICGGGRPAWAEALRGLPIWAFHGTADDVVPVEHTIAMVEALRELNAPVRVTLYEGCDHDSWTRTYADPAVLAWMAAQRRS